MGSHYYFNLFIACICRVSSNNDIIFTTFKLFHFRLIPQAACTRHGLLIGAKFVWYFKILFYYIIIYNHFRLIRILMFFMYPIAFPIARLLEHFLGKHERGFYKRGGTLIFFNLKFYFYFYFFLLFLLLLFFIIRIKRIN